MRKSLSLLILLIASTLTLAAPPTLTVPEVVYGEEGKWGWFKVQTDSKWVEFIGADGLSFFPSEKLKDPTEVGFTGKANTYSVWVMVGNNEACVKKLVVITVIRPPPTPGPNPPTPPIPPNPPPKPIDGELGLIKVSREGLAKTLDPVHRTELAKAQRAHASAVAAGAFKDVASILAGWRKANNEAVDPVPPGGTNNTEKWRAWATDVSTKLATLYTEGKLKTNANWAAAFNEIADGLAGTP